MTGLPPDAGELGPGVVVGEGVIDPAEAVRLLRAGGPARDALIERYGLTGQVERDIADELAVVEPLADPRGFSDAYRRAMHAIEVLDRNGARQPRVPRLGPLKPIATLVIGLVTRWIVRGHQARLISDVRRLVERREAIAEPRSVEHLLLRRARFHAALLEPGYRGAQLGLPAFLAGGAVLTAIGSGAESVASSAFGSRNVGSIVAVATGLALFGASWCALRAAGIARRRIRITTDQAMADLWATIGACGRPPKDQSFTFAVVGIALAALSAFAVPFLIYVILRA